MWTLYLGLQKVVYGPNWFDGIGEKTLPMLGSTTIQSLMSFKNLTEYKLLVQREDTNDTLSWHSYSGFHKVIYGHSWVDHSGA